MTQYDAKYYWEKYHIVEAAWHVGLDMLSVDSNPLHVGELLAIHKLLETLKACAMKHETASTDTANPHPHSSLAL